MPKPKKKRSKKYNPAKHRIAYHEILDISGNKNLSRKTVEHIELDARIHLQVLRNEPTYDSWAYITGLLLMADRLSYDVEEGREIRCDFETAWRLLDDAWRIWCAKREIAAVNLDFVESQLSNLASFFTHFTYRELDEARIYVSEHHLMPVRKAQEKGLSA